MTWSQQPPLTAADGAASDYFGYSVALSANGGTVLVGAPDKMIGANAFQGVVYILNIYLQKCLAGTYDTGTSCDPCAAGSYQVVGLQTACIAAPVGYFVPTEGATSPTA